MAKKKKGGQKQGSGAGSAADKDRDQEEEQQVEVEAEEAGSEQTAEETPAPEAAVQEEQEIEEEAVEAASEEQEDAGDAEEEERLQREREEEEQREREEQRAREEEEEQRKQRELDDRLRKEEEAAEKIRQQVEAAEREAEQRKREEEQQEAERLKQLARLEEERRRNEEERRRDEERRREQEQELERKRENEKREKEERRREEEEKKKQKEEEAKQQKLALLSANPLADELDENPWAAPASVKSEELKARSNSIPEPGRSRNASIAVVPLEIEDDDGPVDRQQESSRVADPETGVRVKIIDATEGKLGTPENIFFSHTLYQIQVDLLRPLEVYRNATPSSFQITRRFNQFETFHARLCAAHPTIKFPSLPEKDFFGRFTPETIQQRCERFNQFLSLVSDHPVLSSSPFLLDFLGLAENLNVKVEEPLDDGSFLKKLGDMVVGVVDLFVEGVDKTTETIGDLFKGTEAPSGSRTSAPPSSSRQARNDLEDDDGL